MKICKTCKEEKQLINFRQSKRHKDGYVHECKNCMSIKRREYFLENYERHKSKSKEYYEKNKKELYEKVDKEKKKINDKNYRKKNHEIISAKILESRKEHYAENKDRLNKKSDRKREIRRKSYKKRKYQYVWREILRKTISQLKLEKKQTTKDILRYSYDDLKVNIESKFENGMSWENHGEWHVDHIIPISLFKEGTNAMIVNKLSNLRPMWKIDNIKKSNKLILDDEYKYLLNEMIFYLIV